MILTEIRLKNFRCYKEIRLTSLERLVIFIGENDAGKTVFLDAISLLISNSSCAQEDFHRLPDGTYSDECIIEGFFRIEEFDTLPDEFRSGATREFLHLWKVFSTQSAKTLYTGLGYEDERFDNFNGAAYQKQLLQEYRLTPESNEAGRKSQRDHLVRTGKLRLVERELVLSSFSMLAPHLPRVERISSSDYRHPDTMVQQTLRSVASRVIKPISPETGLPEEIPELSELRLKVKAELDREIAEAKATLQKFQPKLVDVRIDPIIDFTKSVSNGALTIDLGEGDRSLSSFGEGTKKNLWMGLMEWECQNAMENKAGSVIRLYDEPDVNLHYAVQRRLFNKITEIANDHNLRTQCFVSTHSLTLIDRAPSSAINHIVIGDDNQRSVNRIQSNSDTEEITTFFGEIGRAVGLTNTVLLFERGFLVVEGESEEATIPYLYQLLFKRTMAADGIVLIPLHGCSAWKAVIKILLNNRTEITHLLLDSDCLLPASKLRLTPESLREVGCKSDFLKDQVTYIGDKEFEDSFDSSLIADALNQDFPLEGTRLWEAEVIQNLKNSSPQFSKDMQDLVKRSCKKPIRSNVSKPNIAWAVAKRCAEETVPLKLREALQSLRNRVGAHDGVEKTYYGYSSRLALQ
jgi:putative ATP-dependent endonuclease of the OLD family